MKKYIGIGALIVIIGLTGFSITKSLTSNGTVQNSNLEASAIGGGGSTQSSTITLNVPNGGESYTAGQIATVSWSISHLPITASPNYTITLLGYVNGVQKYSSVLKQFTYSPGQQNSFTGITLPTTIPGNIVPFGNNFKLSISETNTVNGTAQAISTNYFSIQAPVVTNTGCTATSAPSITIVSPNGGETYVVGQSVTVNWTSCNVPASNPMYVGIQGDSTVNSSIGLTDTIQNTGSYTFIVPSQSIWKYLIYGNHYTIRVTSYNPAIIAGANSASPFSIIAP